MSHAERLSPISVGELLVKELKAGAMNPADYNTANALLVADNLGWYIERSYSSMIPAVRTYCENLLNDRASELDPKLGAILGAWMASTLAVREQNNADAELLLWAGIRLTERNMMDQSKKIKEALKSRRSLFPYQDFELGLRAQKVISEIKQRELRR